MSDLDEFLKLIADGKKNNPVAIRSNKIKENVKADLGDLLSEFSQLASPKKQKVQPETPIESKPEPIIETAPIPTPIGVVPPEAQIPDLAAYIPKNQQPGITQRDIKTINDKIKFIEQWVSKIANAGPGSGVAEIYNLDIPCKSVTSDYHIARKDYYIGVNCSIKSYIYLPTTGTNLKDGRIVVVKDESGHAQLTPIKIVGTIDNDPNGAEIRINNGALQLLYSNGSWRII